MSILVNRKLNRDIGENIEPPDAIGSPKKFHCVPLHGKSKFIGKVIEYKCNERIKTNDTNISATMTALPASVCISALCMSIVVRI
jgi:hypothetical protein